MLPGVEPERHSGAECKCRVFAPVIIERRIADLDGAVCHGVEHLQTRNKFAAGKRLNLEAIVGDLGHALAEKFASAVQRIE
jgi:hypothetical protein